MINIHTRPGVLIAGMLSLFAVGCITGTNTFSSSTVPVTRYCGIDETPIPVFDIPATAEHSRVIGDVEASNGSGAKVSLVP